jgi:hypothetical protein
MELVPVLVLIAGVGFVLGALSGRGPAVIVAGLAWPVIALGVWVGVWGNGFGNDDSGRLILAVLAAYTAAAVVGTTIGILARKNSRFAARPLTHLRR